MPTTKRSIRAEDLYQLKFLGDPQISRDGKWSVYVVKSIDERSKQYVSHLELIDLHTHTKKILTRSKHQDTSPRFTPDGSSIVFVSNRTGTNQLWQIPIDGGEAEQLTDFEVGVASPVLSPDGRRIAFSARLKPGEALKLKAQEAKNQASDDRSKKDDEREQNVKVIDRLYHKADGVGYWDGKYSQLCLFDLDTKEARRITDDAYHYREAVWLPEGNGLFAVSNHHDDPDLNFIDDIFEITLDGKVEQISDSKLDIWQVSISPKGDRIAFFASDQTYKNATLSRLYVANRDFSNLVCLTEGWDQGCGDSGMSDMRSHEHTPAPIWSKDGQSLYILSSWHGATQVYNVTLDGQIRQVTSGDWEIYGFDVDLTDSPTLVLAATDLMNPGDLYKWEQTNSKVRLTSVNQTLLDQIELSHPEEFWCKGADGWDIQGWIMKPFGFKEGEIYPTILEVHGGPHAMYSYSFFHEFQLLCANGFAVVFANPRGGEGYGQAFVDAVRGDYGGNDFRDLMAVVDHAITYPFVDADRLGVTGGSYGGFMTNWIVGHTNRFKAAVTQRSISNWLSFYGVSDIGYFFTEWQILGDAWSDTETLWQHSPLAYVQNVQTPLLILHGEQDLRCPIEQADQLFIALKRLGKEVQYVRFPNANHDLSRTGDPKLRVERLTRIVDWFVKHIPVHQAQYHALPE
jgi:dipeptidyl aminopeptidase/acylaminoacyl peptidase